MIILSVMWSTIFCLSTTAWVWYGELVVGHVLFILGIAVTAMTFRAASSKRQGSVATYRDHRGKTVPPATTTFGVANFEQSASILPAPSEFLDSLTDL